MQTHIDFSQVDASANLTVLLGVHNLSYYAILVQIAPRLSVTLYALAHELDAIMDKVQKKQELTGGDVHRGIMDLCKSTGVDHAADRFKVKMK